MNLDSVHLRVQWLSKGLLCTIFLSLIGCTARLYAGPERAPDEISTVSIAKSGKINLNQIVFNDKILPALSEVVEVLPGEHTFRVDYSLSEDQVGCDPKRHYCITTTIEGTCEGSVTTEPGKTYLLWIENKFSVVDARVSAKGYYDFSVREDEPNPGHAYCKTRRQY